MKQLIDEYTFTATGVVNATPVNIMSIPYDSIVSEAPVDIEISCYGTSTDTPTGTVITQFFWVLPIMYYIDVSNELSYPEEAVAIPYNSAYFSKMIHSDSITNFSDLQVIPLPNSTTGRFNLELTVPNNSRSWNINVHVKIFKKKE